MGGKKNGVSGAGFLKPIGGASPACVPGAGVLYFLVGSALGFVAVLHAYEPGEAGGEWASKARRWAAALDSSVRAHALAASVGSRHPVGAEYLLVAVLLLALVAWVWRLGRRCDAVEGRVGGAGSALQALPLGGVLCAVCGSKIQALKRSRQGVERALSNSSKGWADKPVCRSLSAELELEADREEEDNVGETSDSEEGNVEYLRRRLKEERLLKEVALEELEKERHAAASAADEAMAKIAFLRSEKALVERELRQSQEMMKQKQMYDRQMIESLQWVIMKAGMPGWEPEAASADRAVSETSEDDRDRK